MKTLKLIALLFIFTTCSVGVEESRADYNIACGFNARCVSYYKTTVEGMEYGIFGMYYGGTHVVNLTKDKLEIELIKKQLNE